jgi:hypothetical protein
VSADQFHTLNCSDSSVVVRSLYRAGSLVTVAGEIARYKLDLVGVQEIRWDRGGTGPAGNYTFFYGKGNENHEFGIESYQQLRV